MLLALRSITIDCKTWQHYCTNPIYYPILFKYIFTNHIAFNCFLSSNMILPHCGDYSISCLNLGFKVKVRNMLFQSTSRQGSGGVQIGNELYLSHSYELLFCN
jgi:hypothetical protein